MEKLLQLLPEFRSHQSTCARRRAAQEKPQRQSSPEAKVMTGGKVEDEIGVVNKGEAKRSQATALVKTARGKEMTRGKIALGRATTNGKTGRAKEMMGGKNGKATEMAAG